MGIYYFDLGYARLFGKNEVAVAGYQFVRKEVAERLDVIQKVSAARIDKETMKKFLDDPQNEATRKALAKAVQSSMDALMKSARTDAESMDYLLAVFYGAGLEFAYLACKLSLGIPPGEKLAILFHTVEERLGLVLTTLDSIGDPQLQTLMKSQERATLFKSISGRIKEKKGQLGPDDLRFILAQVEPVRAAYLAPCK